MALSQHLVQKQTQKLVITQDLRQSIELLPLSNLELADRIQKELLENPVLEDGNEPGSSGEADFTRSMEEKKERQRQSEADDAISGSWNDNTNETYSTGTGSLALEQMEKKHQFLENGVSSHESLHEHLLSQLRLMDLTAEELNAGEYLLSGIDDHGFLADDPVEFMKDSKIPYEIWSKVLLLIHELDPIGCGAKSVQETLFIQARILKPEEQWICDLIQNHFEDLERLDYKKVEKDTNLPIEQIELAMQFIRTLEPYPGTLISPTRADYIVPDLIIQDHGTGKEIIINDEWIPPLRINDQYRELMTEKTASSKEDQQYIHAKYNSAQWLIKSIGQRRITLFRVMEAILEHQSEFFDRGPGAVKPLTLKDIAEKLELHESTVSRITTNKYVQTRWGTFELKFFFSSSLKSVSGEDSHSARSIQDRIKKLVEEEAPDHPLSDQEIVEKLKTEGVEIARRTVAKYRKILQILPADRRKKINQMQNGSSGSKN